MKYLRCNKGDYISFPIDSPYGIPGALVSKCIEWHEKAYPGHKVFVMEDGTK